MDDSNAFGLCNTGFLRQPARLLIVEAVPPWWSETSGVLCDALDNFLTLVCSLKGPCRLPLFSLYSITSRVERLLPFQKVGWANLPNLRACLEDLRSIPGQGITPDLTSVGDFLRNAVLTSLRRLNDDVRFGRTSVSSVQVTVLTSRPGRNMVHLLRNVPKDEAQMLFTSFLVVQLYNWAHWSEYELTPENPEVAKSSDSHVPVELKQVENNVFAVEAVFKQWLQEYGRDMEHIQLLLRETQSPVSIKCDIEQCVISPSQVSFKNPDMTASPCNNRSVSQGPRMLKAIKLVHASGICHILFHGTSLIVRSTTNGRQDWEEFETNEHRFQVLNQTLESCGQVLLLQEEFPTGEGSSLSSFYVLKPSSSLAMLLSPVACNELFLPVTFPMPILEPPAEVMELIIGCLTELDKEDVLNPSCLRSNLHQYLRSFMVKQPQNPLMSRASGIQPSTEIYKKSPLERRKLASSETSKLFRKSTSVYKAQPVPLRPIQMGEVHPPPKLACLDKRSNDNQRGGGVKSSTGQAEVASTVRESDLRQGLGSSDTTSGHLGRASQASPMRGGPTGRGCHAGRELGAKYRYKCWMGQEVLRSEQVPGEAEIAPSPPKKSWQS